MVVFFYWLFNLRASTKAILLQQKFNNTNAMQKEEYGAFVYKCGMLTAVNENSSTLSASISIFTATITNESTK